MQQRSFRAAALVRTTLVIAATLWLLGQATSLGAEPKADSPQVEAEIAKGEALAERGKHAKAAKAYARADELAGGASTRALLGLALAHYRGGARKEALAAGRRLLETSKELHARPAAFHLVGLSIVGMQSPGRELLEEAEEAFAQAWDASGGEIANALYGLADAQARLGRPEEAFESVRRFLEVEPEGPTADAARILGCDLRVELPDPPELGGEVRLLAGAAGISKPEKLRAPTPEFAPGSATGTASIAAVIDRMGCVTEASVTQGVGKAFDRAALEGVSRWVFRPAFRDGEPVPVFFNLTVDRSTRVQRLGVGSL